ncbi:MAG TPA: hypothetical protein VKD72_21080, partial [Gemmataceae bacterium]|nr:hypothetical protein [Gemmataceae bacterium]
GNKTALQELGSLLFEAGRFQEAMDHFERSGSRVKTERCRRFLKLEADLPAYRNGTMLPAVVDLLDLADLYRIKDLPVTAERFFSEAIAQKVLKPDGTDPGPLHKAVQVSARAGCGQGDDAGDLGEADRAALRAKALDWLRAELNEMMKQLPANQGATLSEVRKTLTRWQRERALAGVRDEDGLAKLPEGERQRWQSFWAEVEALRALAAVKTP